MNEYFEGALRAVEAEAPNLYTPEGLSSLLHSCINQTQRVSRRLVKHECVKDPVVWWGLIGLPYHPANERAMCHIAADPARFAPDDDPEVQAGAGWYAGMGTFLNPHSLSQVMQYHNIRQHIQDLQKQRGISSIFGTNKHRLFGQEIETRDFCDQLILMPEDRPILQAEWRKLFDWFIDVVAPHVERYDILRLVRCRDDGTEDWEPVELDSIKIMQPLVARFSFYGQSFDWVGTDETGYRGIPCDRDCCDDPDDIHLYIGTGELDESGDSKTGESYELRRKDESVIRHFEPEIKALP